MNEMSVKATDTSAVRLIASYLLPLSLFALAGSIVYFTYQVSMVSKQIPDILQRIDTTSEKVEPVIGNVGEIIDLVPPILKEIEEIRKLVPPILKEVEQTRKQIPAVLKESEAIRGELPAVLASADKASSAVADVSKQVEATRPLIPKVLKEVETTRESIPPMMDRADVLIDKARVAGKEASQGAVTGIFSGIIMAPFALISGAGKGLGLSREEEKHYTDKDFQLNEEAVIKLLSTGAKGDEIKWSNPDSGNHAILKLADIYDEGEDLERECRTINIIFFKDEKLFKESNPSLCKNEEGKWELSN